MNFVKIEISELWILWKMRLRNCEFCKKKWDFQNVNFWINWEFLPQCVSRENKSHHQKICIKQSIWKNGKNLSLVQLKFLKNGLTCVHFSWSIVFFFAIQGLSLDPFFSILDELNSSKKAPQIFLYHFSKRWWQMKKNSY